MHLMYNHGRFVKYIHSMSVFCGKKNKDWDFFSSRNARVQADYGLLYMSTIVISSQEMKLEEETEKLIVKF